MTNNELYLLRHTRYGNVKEDARAAEIIAAAYGLSPDSVRGRLSKANTRENRMAVARELALTQSTNSPSIERQMKVIEDSNFYFYKAQDAYLAAGQEVAGVFLSDVHLPYTRWDALELALQIIEYVQPVYVTGLNDMTDNNGYGSWDDVRSSRQRLWTDDLDYLRRTEFNVYRAIKMAMPRAGNILGVMGNHDLWFFTHLQNHTPQAASMYIADYMEWLYHEAGVMVFSQTRENAVHLSPAL